MNNDTMLLKDYTIRILNFTKAILLDEDCVSAGGIAITMANEIQSYGVRILDLLEE